MDSPGTTGVGGLMGTVSVFRKATAAPVPRSLQIEDTRHTYPLREVVDF
jgi:hypothetical protein